MSQTRVDQILTSIMEGNRGNRTLVELLCTACMDAVPVSGVGIALMTDAGHEGVVAATDGTAALMEDLQFTLGEGPCIDASQDRRPVLQPQLQGTGADRWPMFGPAMLDAKVAAIFAFPLQVGAIRLGVMDLYRLTAGGLDDEQLAEALAFADAATILLLHLQDQVEGGGLHPQLINPFGSHSEIHQSTGMIAVQAAVTLAEAMLLLRARSYSDGRPILDLSKDVLARRLSFGSGDGPRE